MKRPRPYAALPASPAPVGRRARRQAETRARILRAALDLFARQGYTDTTIEQITEAADVGKGTFFNYFPSKEHVLAGFGELQLGKVEGTLREALQDGQTAREVWKRLAHNLAKEPGRSPSLARGLLVANLSSDALLVQMRRTLAQGREFLAQLTARGQERGELRRDLNPAEVARLFQQTMLGTLLLWSLDPSVGLAPWLDKTFELFWSVVAAPGSRSRKEKPS